MNETEIKQMREKIDMGIRLARQRLIEKTKRVVWAGQTTSSL